MHVFSAKKGHGVMSVNELRDILNGYFDWNKARLTCFVSMLLALIKVRTINLTELAVGFESEATIDSRYRRIKRFFKEMEISLPRVAVWVVQFFGLSGERLYLSMDRTNWQWGKKNINILMLSIAYKGIAIPLFWGCYPIRVKIYGLNITPCSRTYPAQQDNFLISLLKVCAHNLIASPIVKYGNN